MMEKANRHKDADVIFLKRMERHHDELRWLYMELYGNDSMFAELCDNLRRFYLERKEELKAMDRSGRLIRTGTGRMICWA